MIMQFIVALVIVAVCVTAYCLLLISLRSKRDDLLRKIKGRIDYDTYRWIVITPYGFSEYEGFRREYLTMQTDQGIGGMGMNQILLFAMTMATQTLSGMSPEEIDAAVVIASDGTDPEVDEMVSHTLKRLGGHEVEEQE